MANRAKTKAKAGVENLADWGPDILGRGSSIFTSIVKRLFINKTENTRRKGSKCLTYTRLWTTVRILSFGQGLGGMDFTRSRNSPCFLSCCRGYLVITQPGQHRGVVNTYEGYTTLRDKAHRPNSRETCQEIYLFSRPSPTILRWKGREGSHCNTHTHYLGTHQGAFEQHILRPVSLPSACTIIVPG